MPCDPRVDVTERVTHLVYNRHRGAVRKFFLRSPQLLQPRPWDRQTDMTLASQKVARTQELIDLIIKQVLALTSDLARNNELRSLMVVSRGFSSVALDGLWEKQTSLVPLFLTLRPVARLFRLVRLCRSV